MELIDRLHRASASRRDAESVHTERGLQQRRLTESGATRARRSRSRSRAVGSSACSLPGHTARYERGSLRLGGQSGAENQSIAEQPGNRGNRSVRAGGENVRPAAFARRPGACSFSHRIRFAHPPLKIHVKKPLARGQDVTPTAFARRPAHRSLDTARRFRRPRGRLPRSFPLRATRRLRRGSF